MAGQKGVQDLSSEESDQIESWSQSEELSARRKIDTSVLSLLFLGLLVFQLDCMNFASALTGGFAENVSISHNTVNLGNQLMSFAIIVLEIPSKLILQRVRNKGYLVRCLCLARSLHFKCLSRNGKAS